MHPRMPRLRSDNPMRAFKVNKLVSNNRVGESRDGSVRGEQGGTAG